MMKPNDDVCRLFMKMYAKPGTEIVDCKCIGDYEYCFNMSDGRKFILDELEKSCRYIKTQSNNVLEKEEWIKEFSRKLKRKAQLSGTTLRNISIQTGIPYRTILGYADGESIPNAMAIDRIAKALNCNVTELVDFDYLL